MRLTEIFLFGTMLILQSPTAIAAKVAFHAGEYYQYYQQESGFKRYMESRNFENFEEIEPHLQAFAVAELMVFPDTVDEDRDGFYVEDRSVIMSKHYQKASPAFQAKVNALAFNMAIDRGEMGLAQEMYEKISSTNPAQTPEMICMTLATLANQDPSKKYQFSDDALKRNKLKMQSLFPFIARSSDVANSTCEIPSEGKTLQFTVADLIAKSDPKLLTVLDGAYQKAVAANQAFVQAYAPCNELQLRNLLSDAIVSSHQLKVGESLYFGRQQDQSCVIDAKIIRTKRGYEYAPSNGIAGYMRQTLFFQTLDQLVAQLKSHPSPTLYRKVQPSPPALPAVTAPAEKEINWREVLTFPFGVIREKFNRLTEGRSN